MSYPDLPRIPEIPSHRAGDMTVGQVLDQAQAALHGAELAVHELEDHAPTIVQLALIRTVVIECRRSTFVLQKLRSRTADFAEWYDPIQAGLRADPLMRWFHDLRTQIEKEGLPAAMAELVDVKTGLAFADVACGEDKYGIWVSGAMRRDSKSPPDPTAHPEQALMLRNFRLPDPPTSHRDQPLSDFRFSVLASLVIKYLWDEVIGPAAERFG